MDKTKSFEELLARQKPEDFVPDVGIGCIFKKRVANHPILTPIFYVRFK
jgi:hypothetical protein